MLEGKKVGLVLCGGGGKGSYQIGVWKALKEAGIIPSAIAGSSVGALNGAMMTTGDYATAERMWLSIKNEDVLSLNSPALVSRLARLHIDLARLPLFLRSKGLFSQQGLKAMMDDALPAGFADTPIPFYAALHDKEANEVEYKKINGHDDKTAQDILLASAALPEIFDDIEINDKVYSDGGWYWFLPHKKLDNAPITPLFEKEQCDIIFLVCLSRDDRIERSKYPGVKLLPIVPQQDLGGLFSGVMDFNGDNAKKRIDQGYRDAQQIIQSISGFLENNEEYEKLWQRFAEGEADASSQRERMDEAGREGLNIRKQIIDFNRIVMNDDFTTQMEWINEADNLLEYENRQLLTKIARHEQLEITTRVDGFLSRVRDNNRDIEDAVTDAVSCLAAVPGQSKHLAEQGVIGRFWGMITGNNQKLLADNQHDLAMAQFAALRLISQVQKQSTLLSFEATLAIGNKVNWLFGEVAGLGEEMNRRTVSIYRSLAGVYLKLRNEIRKDRGRIDKLERRVELGEWMNTVEAENASLPPSHRLMKLVNEFYRFTRPAWNEKEIQVILLQALLNAGFRDNMQTIAPKELLCRNTVASLFHRISSVNKGNLSPLLDTAELVKRNELDSDEAAGGWLVIRHGMAADIPVPVYDLAVDLLYGLKRAGFGQQVTLDPMKSLIVSHIKTLEDIAAENGVNPFAPGELECLREQVEQYKFAVPVIGPFNAGKSTLLNYYMGFDQKNEFLKSYNKRETKVATELHYTSGGEKVVLHFIDGGMRSYSIGSSDETLSSLLARQVNEHAPAGNLLYIEAHINNQVLAEHPELILVDMPGLSSGLEAHNKAILNYMDNGTSFILCTSEGIKDDTLQFIRDMALYELDFRVVMTKKSNRIAEEHEDIVRQNRDTLLYETDRQIPIASVESHKGDLDEFRSMIGDLSARRGELFHGRFSTTLNALATRLSLSLKMLLNGENLSTSDLEMKKADTQKKMDELERKLARITKNVRDECSKSLPGKVAEDVNSVLNQNRNALKNQLLNGSGKAVEGRISGLAANEFQLSLGKRARELFSSAEQEINCYVETSVYATCGVSGASADVGDFASGNGGLIGGGAVGLGLLAIGFPILGTIAAGLIYLFSKSDKESEAESALATAFEQVLATVRTQAAQQLENMSARFLASLADKVVAIKKDQAQTIARIEEQLEKCAEEKKVQHDKISADIQRVLALTTAENTRPV
ncbi:MAG: patatin-like phospholipase family protein [Desulfuromonadales bacterium]